MVVLLCNGGVTSFVSLYVGLLVVVGILLVVPMLGKVGC